MGQTIFRSGLLLAILLFALIDTAGAQDTAVVALEVPLGAEAGPNFDAERATQAYIELLSAEDRARSDAYFEGGYWLLVWELIYGLAVALILLSSGLARKMRDLSEKVTKKSWIHTIVFALQYLLLTTLLVFPMTVYTQYFREHQYGLATQTFGSWIGDQFTGLIVTLILGSLALTLIYAVIRKAGSSWWVWAGVVSIFLIFFSSFVAPVYINPLFNEYHSLDDGPIKERTLSLARANGVPTDDVYWFDASRQTTRISANVSGFLGTTRISLNDNLLNRTSPQEIDAVMGHEMGHYVLNHGTKLVIEIGLVLIVGFAFVQWAFGRVLARWGKNWGVCGIGDTAGLPLLSALLAVWFFLMTPVTNSIIRTAEAEADMFGIDASRQPDGFARVAMRLSEYRKINPGHWEEILFFDHPSGRARVSMAMRYKAENLEDM